MLSAEPEPLKCFLGFKGESLELTLESSDCAHGIGGRKVTAESYIDCARGTVGRKLAAESYIDCARGNVGRKLAV